MKPVFVIVIVIISALGLIRITSTSAIYSTEEQTTVIQDAPMDRKQKEHSKLYKEYKTGQKLREHFIRDDNIELHIGIPHTGSTSDSPRFSSFSILKANTCDADAIVVGTVEIKSSQLTEDEEFIFTDYELLIEEVLKDNSAAPILANQMVTITRPGGSIRLNNRNIKAVADSFKLLEIGKRYLLFLRYIPITDSYSALNSKSSFRIHNGKTLKLTDEDFPIELGNGADADSFIRQIRAVLNGGCNEK